MYRDLVRPYFHRIYFKSFWIKIHHFRFVFAIHFVSNQIEIILFSVWTNAASWAKSRDVESLVCFIYQRWSHGPECYTPISKEICDYFIIQTNLSAGTEENKALSTNRSQLYLYFVCLHRFFCCFKNLLNILT